MSSLYVIELAAERIKVGISGAPRARLATHRNIALAHGLQPGRQRWSPASTGTPALERALIKFCADRATEQYGWEYFTGVSFPTATRYAEELTGGGTTEDLTRVREVLDHVGQRDVVQMRSALAAAKYAGTLPRVAFPLEEAADVMSVPVAWLEQLIENRALPVKRVRRRVLIPTTALEDWLDKAAAS